MSKFSLYIFLFLCLISSTSFAYVSDSLSVDSTTNLDVCYLSDDIKDNYSGDDFSYDDSDKGPSWSERFSMWLMRLLARIFNFEATQRGLEITSVIIKILYFLALAALIFFIVRAIMKKEGYWIFSKKQPNAEILSGDIETKLLETDFDALIKKAINDQNFNLATRYYYLKTLKVLSEKGIIEWDPDKTNSDYMYEIKDKELQNQFRYISYIYNYCWYGEFTLEPSAWQQAESGFITFLKSVVK